MFCCQFLHVRYLISGLLLLLVGGVLAQGYLPIVGNLKIEKGNLYGAKVVIMKDGEETGSKALSANPRLTMNLELNATYVLAFMKDGYVTKSMMFTTTVPADYKNEVFEPFKFNISLFKQYEGVNFVMFNQPVGKVFYNKPTDEFTFDTDYTKSIQAQLDAVMKIVLEKQKEEEVQELTQRATPPPAQQKVPVPAAISIQNKPTAVAPKQTYTPVPTPLRPQQDIVRMYFFTASQYGSSNINEYGYINYGNGQGIKPLSKEEFNKLRIEHYDLK